MTSRPFAASHGHGWTLLIRYGTPALIYLAAAPFGAWQIASLWLAVVIVLLAARSRAENAGLRSFRAALEGLLGSAYAAAALHLLNTGNPAAEVLATSMLGVGLFATLIRDYRHKRRLVVNVTPYLVVIAIMQLGAVRAALMHSRGDLIATIVASPLLVGNIFMIMHRDLTAAHRRVASALSEAQSAARTKTDFLANMSHEIRTPLNAVLGYAGLLERSLDLSERDLSHVRAIQVGGDALLAVVNDILDAGRLEAGKMTLNRQPTPTAEFLGESVHLFEPLAASKSLRLRMELSENLPDVLALDGARLRQVLANLIGNAIKFTLSGEIVVRAFYTYPIGLLTVEVEDTGEGIAAHDLPHLFTRFVQADGRGAQRAVGSGLGLSIAKGLIELMGGELSATSKVGVGSTFRVAIPADEAAAPPFRDVDAEDDRQTPAEACILVVDDHPANRALIRAILQSAGHHVEEASNGVEAIQRIDHERYDLVLMDLNMPGMNGYEATAAIRSSGGSGNRIPIVAVSADVMPEQVQRCQDAGLDDHLAKPVSPAALLMMVERWAGHAGADAHVAQTTHTAAA